MTYQETLDYLFPKLAMYQQVGQKAYKENLDNIEALCQALGNPERGFKSVHIAGTNGKGSTAHYLASILQEAGFKTGLFTSPHLKDFRERIRINGELIPEAYLIDFVEQRKDQFEPIGLSFFEWSVGLAFHYFAEEQVDIAIVETGLGGRLDSTNVLQPLLSVITNIGMDHTHLLGDTYEAIATEKAGIIKPQTPVLIGELQPEVIRVFERMAVVKNAPLSYAEELVATESLSGLNLSQVQQKNARNALAAIQMLGQMGWTISPAHCNKGLEKVTSNTGLRGRWDVLKGQPTVVLDTAHNPEGFEALVKQIKHTPHDHLHFVFGMVNDKDPGNLLKHLPQKATYYFCKADLPRALDAKALADTANAHGLAGDFYPSVNTALAAAKAAAGKNDLVLVGGSTFVVAEVL